MKTATEATVIRERHPDKTIALAHGCFDILHPGHIKLLEEARMSADVLVVSVTADEYINKGPDRPVMKLSERIAVLKALRCVDYAIESNAEDCGAILEELRPDVYVKGDEYTVDTLLPIEQSFLRNGTKFLPVPNTGHSTTKVIYRIKTAKSQEVRDYIAGFKARYSMSAVDEALNSLANTSVIIAGEQIIDFYTMVEPLAKSPREHFMSSRVAYNEQHEGGAKAVLNHLRPWISHKSALVTNNRDIVKQRFVHKGNYTKLFGAQNIPDEILTDEERDKLPSYLANLAKRATCVLALDYGHGFFDPAIRQALIDNASFLAVNSQTNSANYGFNLATKWQRAHLACLDGPEYNLAMANGWNPESVETLLITHGADGCAIGGEHVPALGTNIVDNVGAGDALFAFVAPILANGFDPAVAAFIGSCAAALQCGVQGNAHAIDPGNLWDFMGELLD